MGKYVRSAFRNLSRKKTRTFLIICSIAVGMMSLILISAISSAGKNVINQEMESLGVGALTVGTNQKSPGEALDDSALSLLQDVPGVSSVTPIVVENSRIVMRGLIADVMIWGVGPGRDQIISLDPQYGDLFTTADIASKAHVCLLDTSVAEAFYDRENIVGKRIKLQFHGAFEEFEIIGIVKSGGNILQGILGDYLPSFVYIPCTTMQQLLSKPDFDRVAVKIDREEESEKISQDILNALKSRFGGQKTFSIQNVAHQKEQLNRLMDIVTTILSLIVGISLIVSGFGIMIIMLVSIGERTREIGIKKSIGASERNILFEFITEAALISVIGSVIGAALGGALAWAGCLLFHIGFSLPWKFVVFCLGISVAICMAFSAYPAIKAARLSPVDALRSN